MGDPPEVPDSSLGLAQPWLLLAFGESTSNWKISMLCLSLPLETVLTSNTVGHTSSQKQEGKKARNSIVVQGAPGIRPDSIPKSADARRH